MQYIVQVEKFKIRNSGLCVVLWYFKNSNGPGLAYEPQLAWTDGAHPPRPFRLRGIKV